MSTMPEKSQSAPEEQLEELFGSYRAEWLSERIYELFTEPAYFPEMMAPTACVLEGGRGTGKTTVLRGLSYQGQFAIHKERPEKMRDIEFAGCYIRIDTNAVTAFQGPELQESEWVKLFGHYFNLLVCEQLLSFYTWYTDLLQLPDKDRTENFHHVAISLNLQSGKNADALLASVQNAVVSFEAYINNVADSPRRPLLSMQGAPIRLLAEALHGIASLRRIRYFVLLDEYENLLQYQQRIVNTLIKHGAKNLTYKVAIRELGWKCRTTLNADEQLRTPADYVRINIGEKLQGKVFRDFALKVCNDRIQRLRIPGVTPKTSINELLEPLTDDEEAALLVGVSELAEVRQQVESTLRDHGKETEIVLTDTDVLLMRFWARATNRPIKDVAAEAREKPAQWRNRKTNYAHAMLYTLRRGKRGIRKYYAGWDTFIQLADGNLRFLLALVDQCLHLQLREEKSLEIPISASQQTVAARAVGKSNLADLEGLSIYGAKLTKLLLGLGRVFGVLAAQGEGHAPEQTQFELSDEATVGRDEEVINLLQAAVMHLALVRPTGTKPTDDGDTRDYDYMIHPIFAPFFEFSYRRKRKILLHYSDILGVVQKPSKAIQEILERQKRTLLDEPLPEQLNLFRQFYAEPC